MDMCVVSSKQGVDRRNQLDPPPLLVDTPTEGLSSLQLAPPTRPCLTHTGAKIEISDFCSCVFPKNVISMFCQLENCIIGERFCIFCR